MDISDKGKLNLDLFNEDTISIANKMFLQDEETFPKETKQEFVNSLKKGWLTRQYFSRGMHDLVLPAWLLGILGPNGEGRHAIAGTPILKNSDLRSYYALGSPDSQEEPVIDHRGGIIPLPGSYTLIFGTIINDRPFYASEIGQVNVELHDEGYPLVTVYWELDDGDTMVYDAYSDIDDEGAEVLIISVVRGFSDHQLLFTMCPMDQDGITSIPSITYDKSKIAQVIPEDAPKILISEQPIRTAILAVNDGHAGRQINNPNSSSNTAKCQANLTSWASAFPVRANPTFAIQLLKDKEIEEIPDFDMDDVEEKWEEEMENIPKISTSSKEVDKMFKTSATVLRLLADMESCEITVGPSLQEEVWLPALCFQTKALDRLGFGTKVARPILDKMHSKIDTNGVVAPAKQWDAQGAMVMAVANHFYYTNDVDWVGEKFSGIKRITDWITRQRKRKDGENPADAFLRGLLPRGNLSWFDPIYWKNEYVYPNNFWALGAIDFATNIASHLGKHGEVEKFNIDIEKFKQDLDDSISTVSNDYLPVGPYLRDTAGMVFNLHAYYPLRLYLPEFQPLANTVAWLVENYSHNGGLLIDQPWNAYGSYLSILLAQACRFVHRTNDVYSIINFLIDNITNQQGWAEGISPLSRKGAVGDSPNGFAAAEWINLILDLFAEQHKDEAPIFLKGMPVEWLKNGVSAKNINLHFGAKLDITAKLDGNTLSLDWTYDSPNSDKLPHLAIAYTLKELPKDCVQVSSHEIILPTNQGKLNILLEI